MLKKFNPVKNFLTPWLCYRDPNSNLVYFVHSKCACSFYKQLFLRLNWTECTTLDIDWDQDQVFSYIRNPIEKHRVGIVEWFYYNGKVDLLVNNADNEDFFVMLSKIAYLDFHSMSIYEHLGNNSQRVHWIPIDRPEINHKQRTMEFLQAHTTVPEDIKNWFLNHEPVHVSSGFKKQCANKLMALPVDPLITKSIDYDKCIYDAIITPHGFEPDNYSVRIQQLEQQGYTNAQAQEIADQEVETGQYTNW